MDRKTLTRQDISEALYRHVGLSKHESALMLESVLEQVSAALIYGESVKLSSFGTFYPRQKRERIEQVSKHLHPHDDEPDPTAHMGNYNFPQMLFAFCIGFCTMFVLAVDEINDFKGCPLPEYFREPK